MSAVTDKIMKRVRGKGRGWAFTPKDFLDLGTRASIDMALTRLVQANQIRRIGRGLYDYPKLHDKLGALTPDADTIAQAVATQSGDKLSSSGAQAANRLGLSTQVPAQSTYLTDGPSRRVVLGKRVVDLRHASPKHLIAPGSAAGTVVQALRHVGSVRAADVAQVAARRLSANDKKTLALTAVQAPAWMRPTLVSIVSAAVADIDG